MPRRNLNPPPAKGTPPVDSLGRLRLYLDVDKSLATGYTVLAAKVGLSKSALLEKLIRDAIQADPDVARVAGLSPKGNTK